MSAFMHVENEPDYGRVRRYFVPRTLETKTQSLLRGGMWWTVIRQAPRSAVGGYG